MYNYDPHDSVERQLRIAREKFGPLYGVPSTVGEGQKPNGHAAERDAERPRPWYFEELLLEAKPGKGTAESREEARRELVIRAERARKRELWEELGNVFLDLAEAEDLSDEAARRYLDHCPKPVFLALLERSRALAPKLPEYWRARTERSGSPGRSKAPPT